MPKNLCNETASPSDSDMKYVGLAEVTSDAKLGQERQGMDEHRTQARMSLLSAAETISDAV